VRRSALRDHLIELLVVSAMRAFDLGGQLAAGAAGAHKLRARLRRDSRLAPAPLRQGIARIPRRL